MKIRWLVACLTLCFTFSACAHFRSPTADFLRETVDKVWTSKMQGKWGPVYDQANDEYKKYVDRESFIRRANMRYMAYSIEDIRMDKDGKAIITLKFTTSFQGMPFAGKTSEEWLWEKGEWRINMMPYLKTPFGSLIKKPAETGK